MQRLTRLRQNRQRGHTADILEHDLFEDYVRRQQLEENLRLMEDMENYPLATGDPTQQEHARRSYRATITKTS